VRKAKDPNDHLVVVCNFTPVVRQGYRLGVPELTMYREVLNSDSEYYFGSNVGNSGVLVAEPTRWQSQPCSLMMTLPPLSIVVLKPERKG
jgi:1,4-alpha-glucan branching enzyme